MPGSLAPGGGCSALCLAETVSLCFLTLLGNRDEYGDEWQESVGGFSEG